MLRRTTNSRLQLLHKNVYEGIEDPLVIRPQDTPALFGQDAFVGENSSWNRYGARAVWNVYDSADTAFDRRGCQQHVRLLPGEAEVRKILDRVHARAAVRH
jgi:hypothetical protein